VSAPRHRLYRALLRAAPASLRDAHGGEMEALFAERLDEARRAGRLAVARTWVRAALDLLHARTATWTRPGTPLTIAIDERNAFMAGSDFRYALRSLGRQKSATALVVCMLSLGIAANVAVFSLVNGLFLRPLPFPEPDRLVYINETAPRWNLDVVGINYPDFVRWREDMKLFESIACFSTGSFNLSDSRGAERIRGASVTWDFPRVLGLEPMLGRSFTPDEDRPKGPPVVVIGEALWTERFGGDPNILGKSLRLDGVSRTIVGVMPSAASFPDEVRLWVPMGGDANQPYQSYNGDGIGRLKPGVTASDADRDLKRAHQPIWDKTDKEHVVAPFVKPLREQFVRDYRTAASTVAGAVAVLLLIACANVAAVMLARALARRKEMGIRLALGSTRLRLMRQLLVENLVLAAIGGVIGLIAGQWAIRALIRMIPDELPRWAAFQVDARVMFFSLAIVVVTVLLFGWAPALHAVGGDVRSAVHASTGGSTGAPRGRRTLWFLVGGEFALAAMLLVCGALLVKAFDRVRHVDPGFRADHVLTFSVPISEGTRPKPEQWVAFWNQLLERTRRIPGVDAAGLVTCPPLGCHLGNFFTAEGGRPVPDGKDPVVLTRLATPGYFEAMGITLKEGRFLRDSDEGGKQSKVVIVDETFARTFWGEGVSAVGRRLKPRGKDQPWFTVIGVAGDVKHYGLERPNRPGLYFSQSFDPSASMTMAAHTRVDPESIVPAVREALREIDPELPLVGARTMEENLRRSMALRAAFSWMLAVFAFLAFVLAIGGAYGVATYLVTQRTREIGIRVALGARTSDILKNVVGHGLSVVGTGVACGIAGSIAVARLLADALFGVSPADVTVLTLVVTVLVGTALMANGLPARRAARIDPMRSLRTE
jgi:predicted permease